MKLTRAIVPAALAGALILTGCSAGGSPTQDAAGEDCLAGGSVSDGVEVTGTTGEDLELTSETPVSAEEMERTVLKDGEGDLLESGSSISVAMTIFNGASGEALQQQPASDLPIQQDQLATWAYEGVRCAVPGQQATVVAPYAEVFGDQQPDALPFEGITEEDTMIIVMDFDEAGDGPAPTAEGPGTLEPGDLLEKAEGAAKDAPEGFPSVELAENGEPTITVPEGAEAPAELSVATLIEGEGEEVLEGDRVYVNYRGVIWRTGEEFDSSWSRGQPIDFVTTEVIPGFSEALVGQKVGSQVISVVPAEDGGYGADALQQQGHEPDDVMVFVLDILGTVHADAE